MTEGLWVLAGGVLAIALGIALSVRRSAEVLRGWADAEGFELLHSEPRYLFRGPFSLTTEKGQTVYRVMVRDRSDRTRTGWVRCGHWFWGLSSDDTEVRWED